MSSGTAAASDTMCWPVPLAISKAHPRRGAKGFTSDKMAGIFCSADGGFNRPFAFILCDACRLWKVLSVHHLDLRVDRFYASCEAA